MPAREPLPLENPCRETTVEGVVFVLRLNDPNLTVQHLEDFDWRERDRLIVRINPTYDSTDPDKLHMINWENRHTYMTPLVKRAKAIGNALAKILGASVDAGFMCVKVEIGNC